MNEVIEPQSEMKSAVDSNNTSSVVTDKLPTPAPEPGALVTNQNTLASPVEPAKSAALVAGTQVSQPPVGIEPPSGDIQPSEALVTPPAGTDSPSGSTANISPEPTVSDSEWSQFDRQSEAGS